MKSRGTDEKKKLTGLIEASLGTSMSQALNQEAGYKDEKDTAPDCIKSSQWSLWVLILHCQDVLNQGCVTCSPRAAYSPGRL